MANRETDRPRRPEQTSSFDDDIVRGRADEMEDAAEETDGFEDNEDLDEEDEDGEGSF